MLQKYCVNYKYITFFTLCISLLLSFRKFRQENPRNKAPERRFTNFTKLLANSLQLCYHMVCLLDAPACRNGRRGRLKICCGQPRMGSSPIAGIVHVAEILVRSRISAFYFAYIYFDDSHCSVLLYIKRTENSLKSPQPNHYHRKTVSADFLHARKTSLIQPVMPSGRHSS